MTMLRGYFFLNTVQLTWLKLHFDQVQKKPGKVNEELLSDGTEENDTGFWKSLTRYGFEMTNYCFYNE